MSQKLLQFRISSALKDIIGRDLITDDYIAIFELVKNSYDAHATKVEIIFENIYSSNAKIIIKDNGKGMNYDDLNKKWLFVAYSAKKEGTEDKDYRKKIYKFRPFAGAKGIGRFSCDRLGKHLHLESIKHDENKAHILDTNWELFESDIQKDFINVSVEYNSRVASSVNQGTILEISQLRSEWNRAKLLTLKNSLAKLINPNKAENEKQKFDIKISAPAELEKDKEETEYYNIVNGEVKNFIFETLELKTTKIDTRVSADGKYIITELKDGGTQIYKITEKNIYNLLADIHYVLYYLNTPAKNNFTRYMGVQAYNFGSVTLYKNNFRIYPFGEPGEDTIGIDRRKGQGYARFLGTRELIGRIEISDLKDQFKETSSRDGGLIKTEAYHEMVECFFEKVLKRLEKYVVDIQQWGLGLDDEGTGEEDATEIKAKSIELIAKLSNANDIVNIEYNSDFLNILEYNQQDSASALLKNIKRIANESNSSELIDQARKIENRLRELQLAKEEAEKEAEEEKKKSKKITAELDEIVSENLFLKSIKSQDFDEIVSFLHHIGIAAGTVDNYLNGVFKRINAGDKIDLDQLKKIIEDVSFENRKIMSIAKFATKANFKLFTEEATINLVDYIHEYLFNVIGNVKNQGVELIFKKINLDSFNINLRPIEINILIDNFLSNSKKAGATKFEVLLRKVSEQEIEITFRDDGKGILDGNLKKLFEFGYTTSSGSGLGLFHIKKILDRLKSTIRVNNQLSKGVEFIINFKK